MTIIQKGERMSDLISRQAAIDIIEAGRLTKLIDAETAVNGLKELPPAQPEQPTEVQDILQYLDEYLHPIVSPEHWSVYSELYDIVSMLQSSQPEQRWIPCSERLPEEGQKCLVCDKGSIGIDAYIGHGNPYNWKWYVRDYEAWIPLPEPYIKGDTK